MNTIGTIYGDAPGLTRKAYYTGRQVGATFLRSDHLKTSNDTTRAVVNYDLAIGDIVQYDPFSPQPSVVQPAAALATTQAGLNATLGLGACVGAPNIGASYRGAATAGAVTAIGADWAVTPADSGANDTFIQPRLFVVTHVHPDINRKVDPTNSNTMLAAERAGGWVDICPIGITDALFYKNTDVLVPAGTPLGLWMPATTAGTTGYLLGSSTANVGKPAFTNLLDADLDRASSTSVTVRRMLDILSRIQAIAMESIATDANGGGATATVSLRKVALGSLYQFGM